MSVHDMNYVVLTVTTRNGHHIAREVIEGHLSEVERRRSKRHVALFDEHGPDCYIFANWGGGEPSDSVRRGYGR